MNELILFLLYYCYIQAQNNQAAIHVVIHSKLETIYKWVIIGYRMYIYYEPTCVYLHI